MTGIDVDMRVIEVINRDENYVAFLHSKTDNMEVAVATSTDFINWNVSPIDSPTGDPALVGPFLGSTITTDGTTVVVGYITTVAFNLDADDDDFTQVVVTVDPDNEISLEVIDPGFLQTLVATNKGFVALIEELGGSTFLASVDGKNWEEFPDGNSEDTLSYYTGGDNLIRHNFSGRSSSFYRSTDLGQTWESQAEEPFTNADSIADAELFNDEAFVLTAVKGGDELVLGIAQSADGFTWTETEIDTTTLPEDLQVTCYSCGSAVDWQIVAGTQNSIIIEGATFDEITEDGNVTLERNSTFIEFPLN